MSIESVVQGRALHLTFEFDDIIYHILNIYMHLTMVVNVSYFIIKYMIILVYGEP